MRQIVPARNLSRREVEHRFDLQQVYDEAFFSEAQLQPMELKQDDQMLLDRAKADFLYLAKDHLHEEIIKLVVLSPLLSAAGFYRQPFRPVAERQVELEFADDDPILRGRLDILVLNERLWVTVIEAKSSRFNVLEAIPQTLFYMLASPSQPSPLFGLATNGSDFLFLKLVQGEQPQYGFSRLFSLLNPGNDLYQVSTILQQLGQRVAVAV
ncbi:MAG: restriction endonuclease subunit R [Spirulina sp. SIO3F2]|nr:restriction endonuclease subunit R [Spirulina sp. SIO3F2]